MIRSIEFRAMNTPIMLAAEGERALEGMYATKTFIDDSEQRFSRFLPASEVSILNRFAGEWHHVSDELMDMLQLSMKYHMETHGLFDPSILPELKRAGYDRSMDEIRVTGAGDGSHATTQSLQRSFTEVEIDHANQLIRLPHDMEIDLSGIAKGWIVSKAAQLLHAYVDVCAVSAGGDIQFIGEPSDGFGWDVYLENPRDETQMLAQLHLRSGGVATSSVMKRSWTQGDKIQHHLIDPRTGEPAQTDWLSVTVISTDVIHSDIYAKVILIGGERESANLLQAKEGLTYIAVDSQGKLLGSRNYKDYIYEFTTDPSLTHVIPH